MHHPARVAWLLLCAAASLACTNRPTAPPPITPMARAVGRGLAAKPATVDAGRGVPDAGGVTQPCRAGTAEHREAEAALERLDQRIDALAPEGDPKPLSDELDALLDSRCFALSHASDALEFDSGLSLRTWWTAGGKDWVSQYLALDRHHTRATGGANTETWVFVSPTPRRTLTRESAPTSPLASLLCPVRDDACGRDTRGWLTRAQTFYELHETEKRTPLRRTSWNTLSSDDPRTECHERALADQEPFSAFQACMLEHTERPRALPLGRFRAPKDGWLVLRGRRRGDSSSCDELRAYDLATGTAYVAGTCRPRIVVRERSVDGTIKTLSNPTSQNDVGRLPLENLREAALMTFLAPHTQSDVIENGFGWVLPDDIVPQATYGRTAGEVVSRSSSVRQTTIAWSWIKSGHVVVSGTLVWPNDYNDASQDHAVRLVAIAEAGFEPLKPSECAAAAPPSPLPLPSGQHASEIEANPDNASRLETLRRRACAGGRGR
jgi:hypothetical protein